MRSLSKDQIHALLSAAKAHRERDWLMILVGFLHGLRVSELLSIQPDDVKDGFLTVQRLKGSMRTVQELFEHPDPLLSERQALIDYARKSIPGKAIFGITRQRCWQIMREHGERAGIPRQLLFPHILKHTLAMQTIHIAGIENVRQRLGHRSMSSTGEYLKVSDGDASAAVARALK